MTLRADDGTPLVPKEAIVLDVEGNPIEGTSTSDDYPQSKVRVYKMSGWLAPLIVLGVVAIFALGTFFLIGGVVILLFLALIRFIYKALS